MKTFIPKIITGDQRKWHIIDASNVVLGKLAAKIAPMLRGKHRPTFTPHLDLGDYVIIINAEKIKLSGEKMKKKIYYKHTGYIGHLKQQTAEEMMEKDPTKIIYLAVKGMIPHTKLRDDMLQRLKIFAGSTHEHEAQQPEEFKVA
ncbi:50S ribosomal protein L13 [Candidatus Peregrinibacteria bacterium]|jgi:large subunit ribosomal protein L13|nr:50S ribosomal protein L13 [Candidatus Peregrinibacteria bacterium]